MADGFRKALFGFNCDDVAEYVKKTHKEFSEKEQLLNEKIEELTAALSASNRKVEDLTAEKAGLEATLKEYADREEEIKQISENIGKLYIVSQANAKAIIENAEENRRIAAKEVEHNLSVIKTAHEALSKIVKGVTATSVDFTDRVKLLSTDLEATKKKIEKNEQKNDESAHNLKLVKEDLN